MGSSLREVPDITIVEDLFLVSAILINGRNKNRALIDNTPFSLFVLVHHRSSAGLERNIQHGASGAHEWRP